MSDLATVPQSRTDAAIAPAPLQTTTNHYNVSDQISDQQRKAILLILAGKSDSAVACIIGVHRVTVTNWRLRNQDFQDELFRARDQLWSAELDKLRALLFQSLKEIQKQLKNPYSEVRFRAAKTLLPLVGSPRLEPRPPHFPKTAALNSPTLPDPTPVPPTP